MNLASFLGIFKNFNLGGIAKLSSAFSGLHFIFAGLILVFLLLYGISLGRTRTLVSLLGIYIAFVFNTTFVYFGALGTLIKLKDTTLLRVGLFVVVYLIVFFVLNRSLVKARLTLKEVSFFSVLMISILQLGLLVSIILNMLSPTAVKLFPSIFLNYFGNKTALFYWVLAPIIILLFIKNERHYKTE